MNQNINSRRTNFSPWLGLLVMVLFFVALYYLAKGVFTIISFLAPVLLIAALIIRRQVVFDYGKMLWRQLKENTLIGILLVVLTVVGYPFVSAFLFGKALLRKKVDELMDEAGIPRENQKEKYTDYEEIDEELDLKPLQNANPDEYEDLINS